MMKIGVGVGVPLGIMALAAGAYALWFVRRKGQRDVMLKKSNTQWELDADESALTREQYEKKRKDAAAELNGDVACAELEHRQGPAELEVKFEMSVGRSRI